MSLGNQLLGCLFIFLGMGAVAGLRYLDAYMTRRENDRKCRKDGIR